jgi:hypothetical protein
MGIVVVGAALLALAPMGAAAQATVTIGNSGPFAVTVSPGAVIGVELTGEMSLGQPHPYAVPTSSNPAILAPISGSTDAQARTHATYRAVAPGSATLSGSGPSGIMCPPFYATPGPGCIGVAAILFRVSVTVSAATITGPSTGGGSPPLPGAGGARGGVSAWTLVLASSVGAGALACRALARRARRSWVPARRRRVP